MHQTTGQRDPSTAFPIASTTSDAEQRRQANRAIGWSAVGLAATGLLELVAALVTGSVALLSDALHNLSDVSTSVAVYVGFRASKRTSTARHPYGYGRAEDVAGVLIAMVIWASAVLAGVESLHKLFSEAQTRDPGLGIAAAVVGIVGNQLVARYKLRVGRKINSATLISDAKHSWLDALSSAGALVGLIAVLLGVPWADAVAGIVVTGFIAHVGWEVTADLVHRLLDGVDPEIVETAERVAATVSGVQHAHARARWMGRTLLVEIEGWVQADSTVREADAIGQAVADELTTELPAMREFTWSARGF